MADKVIVCKDCGTEFLFNENEQAFYADKGFTDPLRCKDCRKARKQQKRESERSNYNNY
jgi:DNA replicative helicase MCM subunit Mcm2 (Cdc46/Mcm family)